MKKALRDDANTARWL